MNEEQLKKENDELRRENRQLARLCESRDEEIENLCERARLLQDKVKELLSERKK